MKITISGLNAAGQKTTLTVAQGTTGLHGSSGSVIQEVMYFRGPEPKFFNRFNKKNTMTFSVWREHVSAAQAELFLLDHPEALPVTGVITFWVEFDGFVYGNRFAQGAMVIADFFYRGASTWHSYQLSCGRITRTAPTL